MSTTTIINLVRWRIRDFAACFYACRLPPIDEPDCSTCTDQVPKKKMVFDPIGEGRRRENDRQKLRRKKPDQERASLECSKQTRNSKKSEDRRGESSLSSFAEEEYIVFCFRDDGEIQIVKEKRSSEASHDQINRAKQRSGSVNHRPKKAQSCNESDEETSNSSHVDVVTSRNIEDTALADEHVEEEGSNDAEVEWPHELIKEINQIRGREGRTLSSMLSIAESSDSNRSDASTGSFAFPVLGKEWIGSPVHMPKPEDRHLRKQKARVVRLHCCRF